MSTPVKRAQALIVQLHQEVPLTAAMQLALQSFDDSTLVFRVPLLPNINDKGTGFAGSITSLGCITGWSLLTLWSEPLFGHCQCAVYDA
ncbi:MAG TPA: YiiD C-terminal domain-containing protein, partial [Moraxellaceae bacterium]|nr:YiiD C-terminal domain-containing protein [Moraxellaceae bacterium]